MKESKRAPIFMEVTRSPHALRRTPMLLAVTPFPSPLTTPPVTNTYFISFSGPCDSNSRSLAHKNKKQCLLSRSQEYNHSRPSYGGGGNWRFATCDLRLARGLFIDPFTEPFFCFILIFVYLGVGIHSNRRYLSPWKTLSRAHGLAPVDATGDTEEL